MVLLLCINLDLKTVLSLVSLCIAVFVISVLETTLRPSVLTSRVGAIWQPSTKRCVGDYNNNSILEITWNCW